MVAEAERHVCGVAVDAEPVGVLELVLVTIRRRIGEQDLLPGEQLLAVQLRVLDDGAAEGVDR